MFFFDVVNLIDDMYTVRNHEFSQLVTVFSSVNDKPVCIGNVPRIGST